MIENINKEQLEKIFDEKFYNWDCYMWRPNSFLWQCIFTKNNDEEFDEPTNLQEVKSFIFDTIILEVLNSVIPNKKNQDDNSEFEWWYNRWLDEIKQKAKQLYWIDL